MHKIIEISILHTYESCDRHTYYVRATTDEGMTKEVEGHATGSLYTEVDGVRHGLTRDEARDRALMDADTWGQFLGITPTPYVEDGVTHEPSMTLGTYDIQREMATERKAKQQASLDADIIGANTSDAYSAGNYPDGQWEACAQLLLDRGLNQDEAEAFLRSKHMRWCYDSAEDPCNATAAEFERYLNNQRNMAGLTLKQEAEQLVSLS